MTGLRRQGYDATRTGLQRFRRGQTPAQTSLDKKTAPPRSASPVHVAQGGRRGEHDEQARGREEAPERRVQGGAAALLPGRRRRAGRASRGAATNKPDDDEGKCSINKLQPISLYMFIYIV